MASAQALQKETHSVVIVSFPRRECARDPVHTLVKSVIRVGTSGLTESLPVSRIVQALLISGLLQRVSPSLFLNHLFVNTADLLFVELAGFFGHLQFPDVIFQQFVQRPGNLTSLASVLQHLER